MARIKCCECGEIFRMQSGDIQICPKCNAKMRINVPHSQKPQKSERINGREDPARENVPGSVSADNSSLDDSSVQGMADEYSSIRNEYAEIMRKQIENDGSDEESMVVIPKRIYDELVSGAILTNSQEMKPSEEQPYFQTGSDNSFDVSRDEPESPRRNKKSSSGVFAMLMVLVAFAASAASFFVPVFKDAAGEGLGGKNVLQLLIYFFDKDMPLPALVVIAAYVLIIVGTIFFLVNRKSKPAKIFGGLFYIFESVGIAGFYSIYELIIVQFRTEYLLFWNYYTIIMVAMIGVIAFAGLLLFIAGLAAKRKD